MTYCKAMLAFLTNCYVHIKILRFGLFIILQRMWKGLSNGLSSEFLVFSFAGNVLQDLEAQIVSLRALQAYWPVKSWGTTTRSSKGQPLTDFVAHCPIGLTQTRSLFQLLAQLYHGLHEWIFSWLFESSKWQRVDTKYGVLFSRDTELI
jgi:hypothetical protein